MDNRTLAEIIAEIEELDAQVPKHYRQLRSCCDENRQTWRIIEIARGGSPRPIKSFITDDDDKLIKIEIQNRWKIHPCD